MQKDGAATPPAELRSMDPLLAPKQSISTWVVLAVISVGSVTNWGGISCVHPRASLTLSWYKPATSPEISSLEELNPKGPIQL